MLDLFSEITPKRVISPVSVSDNTPQVGQVIDHQGFGSATYCISVGAIADANATFIVLLEHDDNGFDPDGWAVDDSEMVGTEVLASFQFDDDNECRKLGYIGPRRYSRLTITPVGNASAAMISAFVLLGHPAAVPTPNPPT